MMSAAGGVPFFTTPYINPAILPPFDNDDDEFVDRKPLKRPLSDNALWTQQDDVLLSAIVQQLGTRNWSDIAKRLNGRTAKQCRERWQGYLDPGLDRRPFTVHEQHILASSRHTLGNKWSEIAKLLPGRSETMIKLHCATLPPQAQPARRKDKSAPAAPVGGMSLPVFAAEAQGGRTKAAPKRAYAQGKENVPPKPGHMNHVNAADVNAYGKRVADAELDATVKRPKRQYTRRKKADANDSSQAVPGTAKGRPVVSNRAAYAQSSQAKGQLHTLPVAGFATDDDFRGVFVHDGPLVVDPHTMEPCFGSRDPFAFLLDPFDEHDISPAMQAPYCHSRQFTPPSILRKTKRMDFGFSPFGNFATPFSPSMFFNSSAPTPFAARNAPPHGQQPQQHLNAQQQQAMMRLRGLHKGAGHVMSTPLAVSGLVGTHSMAETPTPLRLAMNQFATHDDYPFMSSPMLLVPEMQDASMGLATPSPLLGTGGVSSSGKYVLNGGRLSVNVRTPPTGRTPKAPFQFKCKGRSPPLPKGQTLQLTSSLFGTSSLLGSTTASGGRAEGTKHAVFDFLGTPVAQVAPYIPTLSQQCASINARTARIRRGISLGDAGDDARRLSFASSVPDIGKSPAFESRNATPDCKTSMDIKSPSVEELESNSMWQTVLGQTADQKYLTTQARHLLAISGRTPLGLCDRLTGMAVDNSIHPLTTLSATPAVADVSA